MLLVEHHEEVGEDAVGEEYVVERDAVVACHYHSQALGAKFRSETGLALVDAHLEAWRILVPCAGGRRAILQTLLIHMISYAPLGEVLQLHAADNVVPAQLCELILRVELMSRVFVNAPIPIVGEDVKVSAMGRVAALHKATIVASAGIVGAARVAHLFNVNILSRLVIAQPSRHLFGIALEVISSSVHSDSVIICSIHSGNIYINSYAASIEPLCVALTYILRHIFQNPNIDVKKAHIDSDAKYSYRAHT